jgi:hypothetical protein
VHRPLEPAVGEQSVDMRGLRLYKDRYEDPYIWGVRVKRTMSVIGGAAAALLSVVITTAAGGASAGGSQSADKAAQIRELLRDAPPAVITTDGRGMPTADEIATGLAASPNFSVVPGVGVMTAPIPSAGQSTATTHRQPPASTSQPSLQDLKSAYDAAKRSGEPFIAESASAQPSGLSLPGLISGSDDRWRLTPTTSYSPNSFVQIATADGHICSGYMFGHRFIGSSVQLPTAS